MAAPNYQTPSWAGHCDFLKFDENELDTSDLHARFIDAVTTQGLLSSSHKHPWASYPSSSHTNNDDEASTLLSALTCLAPSVAKDFTTNSSSSIPSNLQFRLIHDIDDLPGEEESYIAMSYVWKTPSVHETPRKMVSPVGDLPFGWVRTVEQFPLPIGRGLFMGVLGERNVGEGVWFDQVCVEMGDDSEKAVTVGAMGEIYRGAREVVVALDDVTATRDEMGWLQRYVQQYIYSDLRTQNRGWTPPFMQQHGPFSSFMERVLGSAWFERAWCAMEMRMARSLIFLVPCVAQEDEACTLIRFTVDFFVHMLVLASELIIIPPSRQAQIRSLLDHFSSKTSSPTGSHSGISSLAVRSPKSTKSTSLAPSRSVSSFIPTIAEIFGMKAGGNPRLQEYMRRLDANRDKTSICLNIFGIPLSLKPTTGLQRPAIEDECLRQLLLVGLAARDPVALCTTGSPLQLHDGSVSWLCRPTGFDVSDNRGLAVKKFEESKGAITQGSDGRAEFVELDLVFLDLPHRSQPNPRFPSHVHRAHEFIDICVQYHVQSHSLWNMWQAHTPPNQSRGLPLRNIFIQTLACAFDCGAKWLLDVASQFPSTSSTASPLDAQALETLFNPQLILDHYIHHPTAFQSLSALLNVLASLISAGIPWASGASECTHGPLIITTPSHPANSSTASISPPLPMLGPHGYPVQQTQHQIPISPSIANKAIIFAPFAHSKTLLIAVPSPLTSSSYMNLARAWILTPNNPYTGSYVRTGSGSIGGNGGANPGGQKLVSWVLNGKGIIFGGKGSIGSYTGGGVDGNRGAGEGAYGEGGEVRRHRVYGPGGGA